MTVEEVLARPWVIGPGRLGLTLAAALADSAGVNRLSVLGRSAGAPRHPVFDHRHVRYAGSGDVPEDEPSAIILAVPDRVIAEVARDIAGWNLAAVPVLHTSGALGADVLAPLARGGFPTGSMHPLAAVPGDTMPGRLAGVWFGVEGDASDVAEVFVRALGGRAIRVDAGSKARYHAASVLASNYVVALLSVAEEWMTGAGVSPPMARAALTQLAAGAVADVAALGPAGALTGPVSRGDAGTIALHLSGLSPSERSLYSVLAKESLALARIQGLDPAAADRIAELVGER